MEKIRSKPQPEIAEPRIAAQPDDSESTDSEESDDEVPRPSSSDGHKRAGITKSLHLPWECAPVQTVQPGFEKAL